MKPQILIQQDFGGVHNADLKTTSARLLKGGSWKKQRVQEQQHDWYVRNAEKKKAAARAYYAAHRLERIKKALEYRKENPGVTVESHRRRMYGLSSLHVEKMLIAQERRCAICRIEFDKSTKGRTPHVDHSHKTGRVRGLLCAGCNTSLGHVEREGFLEAAMRYLGER